MQRIAGVAMQTTATGKITKVTIDMKRWGHLMEDVLDAMAVERAKEMNDFSPFSDVVKRLDKKHGIKR